MKQCNDKLTTQDPSTISPNANNVTWFSGQVTQKDREGLHGHKAAVIWFTGLSASGKSTIAHHLEELLHKKGYSTYVFDGDNVRHGLCGDLGFSPEDRVENIRRIGEIKNGDLFEFVLVDFRYLFLEYMLIDAPDLRGLIRVQ